MKVKSTPSLRPKTWSLTITQTFLQGSAKCKKVAAEVSSSSASNSSTIPSAAAAAPSSESVLHFSTAPLNSEPVIPNANLSTPLNASSSEIRVYYWFQNENSIYIFISVSHVQ